MKFKSKVDWYIHIAFIFMLIATIYLIIHFILTLNVTLGVCASIFIICNVIIIPWWVNMHYILDENELVIHLGGLGKGKRIAYSDITSVRETRDPLSSAALSMDRIEIKFKTGKSGKIVDMIYISPKDKQIFMKMLEEKRAI